MGPVYIQRKPTIFYKMNGSVDYNVVISGISGRFPKSQNVEELSGNLYGKVILFTNKDEANIH